MHVLDTLTEFGTTGRLGLMHRGASMRDLAAAYGPPWDIGRIRSTRRWPHLYSYGDVEFVACRCRIVTSISVPTWRGTVRLPDPGTGGAGPIPSRVTYDQMAAALTAAGCRFEPLPALAGQVGLRTEPERIEFIFVTDGPEHLLDRAATWSYPHQCLSPAEVAASFPDGFPAERVPV
jgi:hypothetical protein